MWFRAIYFKGVIAMTFWAFLVNGTNAYRFTGLRVPCLNFVFIITVGRTTCAMAIRTWCQV